MYHQQCNTARVSKAPVGKLTLTGTKKEGNEDRRPGPPEDRPRGGCRKRGWGGGKEPPEEVTRVEPGMPDQEVTPPETGTAV